MLILGWVPGENKRAAGQDRGSAEEDSDSDDWLGKEDETCSL